MTAFKMPPLEWVVRDATFLRLDLLVDPTLSIHGELPKLASLIGEASDDEKPAYERGFRCNVSVGVGVYRDFGLRLPRLDQAKRAAWLLGLDELVKALQRLGPEEIQADCAQIASALQIEMDALRAVCEVKA